MATFNGTAIDGNSVLIDPTGLTSVTATDAQGAVAELDTAVAAAGGEDLAATLVLGNSTGANPILFDRLDPTSVSPGAAQGSIIVSDGTGGTRAGEPYFVSASGTDILPLLGGEVQTDTVSGTTASTTISDSTALYEGDANSSGTINATLPSASKSRGKALLVKHKGDGTGTVNALSAGGDTVEGGASLVVAFDSTVALLSDGVSNWIQAKIEGPGGGGGGEDLAATLALGNSTGGTNIVMSSGDQITSAAGADVLINPASNRHTVVGPNNTLTSATRAFVAGRGNTLNLTAGAFTGYNYTVFGQYHNLLGAGYLNTFFGNFHYTGGNAYHSMFSGYEQFLYSGAYARRVLMHGSRNDIFNNAGSGGGVSNSMIVGRQIDIFEPVGGTGVYEYVYGSWFGGSAHFIAGDVTTSLVFGNGHVVDPNLQDSALFGDGHTLTMASVQLNLLAAGQGHNIAESNGCFVAGRAADLNSAPYSASVGRGVILNAPYSQAWAAGAQTDVEAQAAWGSGNTTTTWNAGKGQRVSFTAITRTTDATSTVLTTDGGAAGASNRLTIPPNRSLHLRGEVVAVDEATNDTAAWEISATIKRDGAGNTTLVGSSGGGSPVFFDGGGSGWNLSITADDTNEALQLQVTGAAATNIRWTASLWGGQTGF